jgi:hypothetical protein
LPGKEFFCNSSEMEAGVLSCVWINIVYEQQTSSEYIKPATEED